MRPACKHLRFSMLLPVRAIPPLLFLVPIFPNECLHLLHTCFCSYYHDTVWNTLYTCSLIRVVCSCTGVVKPLLAVAWQDALFFWLHIPWFGLTWSDLNWTSWWTPWSRVLLALLEKLIVSVIVKLLHHTDPKPRFKLHKIPPCVSVLSSIHVYLEIGKNLGCESEQQWCHKRYIFTCV